MLKAQLIEHLTAGFSLLQSAAKAHRYGVRLLGGRTCFREVAFKVPQTGREAGSDSHKVRRMLHCIIVGETGVLPSNGVNMTCRCMTSWAL